MVEHAAHNRGVAGSIPATATIAATSGLIPPGRHVLVAISGGADSTALLLALLALPVRVTAAHYDHALRPDSARDAGHVRELCSRLGVPLLEARRAEAIGKGSPEAAARRLRLDFLERARAEAGADLIALGHTADDLAEGVLLHLLRGCGLAGARGMPPARGRLVRPLLVARRADLRAALREAGIGWLEDPTNADRGQARARLRHELLPRLESDRPGLTGRLLGAAAAAAELQARLAEEAARLHEGPRAQVDGFDTVSDVVLHEVLRRLYVAAGGAEPGLGRAHLSAMARLTRRSGAGGSLDLPGGFVFRRSRHSVEAVRTAVATAARPPGLQQRACSGCSSRSAVHLPAGSAASVGYRRPGLRLRRPGGHTRKLQDLLVDAHVPRWERDRLPLLFVGDRLAWVPGVAADPELVIPTGRPGLHIEFKSRAGEKVAW